MRISQRPIVKLVKKPIDRYMETLSLLFSLCLIAIPFYYYSNLPDIIPIHFNAQGEIDQYSNKIFIWLVPIIGISIHLFLKWLNKRPHTFNYIVKITEENAVAQYTLAVRMMHFINVLTLALFTSIVYEICKSALGEKTNIGIFYIITFVLLIFLVMGIYLYFATKKYDKQGIKNF